MISDVPRGLGPGRPRPAGHRERRQPRLPHRLRPRREHPRRPPQRHRGRGQAGQVPAAVPLGRRHRHHQDRHRRRRGVGPRRRPSPPSASVNPGAPIVETSARTGTGVLELLDRLVDTLTTTAGGTVTSVLWFQGGACCGNTMSFINAAEPSVVDLIVDYGLEIVYHPTLSMEIGKTAQDLFWSYARGEKEIDIFVYEGSVIEGPNGTGRFDMFADRPMKDWVDDIAPKAGIVVAIGDCATWGGLPAVPPEPVGQPGPAVRPRRQARRLPRPGLRQQARPAGHQHPRLPGAPRLDHPDHRGAGRRPGRRPGARRAAAAEDLLHVVHADRLHARAVLRLQAGPAELRPGHAHRLPVLRVRLPRAR